jgi:hypothetical protein
LRELRVLLADTAVVAILLGWRLLFGRRLLFDGLLLGRRLLLCGRLVFGWLLFRRLFLCGRLLLRRCLLGWRRRFPGRSALIADAHRSLGACIFAPAIVQYTSGANLFDLLLGHTVALVGRRAELTLRTLIRCRHLGVSGRLLIFGGRALLGRWRSLGWR